MYEFLLIQWKMGKLTLAKLNKLVANGIITQEQMDAIVAS